MLTSTNSISKHFSSPEELIFGLASCNSVYKKAFLGTEDENFVATKDNMSDFVLLAYDENGLAVGVAALTYHEKGRALEVRTVAAYAPYKDKDVLNFLAEKEVPVAVRRWCGGEDAWLTVAVMQSNRRFQAELNAIGFSLPPSMMEGILEDRGYVPFDPVDHVLMKRQVNFAAEK